MQVPTTPEDQPPDPRESTVSMPRIDPSWLADQVSGHGTAANARAAGGHGPGLGDPYAAPVRAPEPLSAAESAARSAPPTEASALVTERTTPSAVPAEPAVVGAPAMGSAARQPSMGSVAELRARLAQLPVGHPSSPYDDAGRLKPAPPRLRHLELGLPARSHGAPGTRPLAEIGTEPVEPEPVEPEPVEPEPFNTEPVDTEPAGVVRQAAADEGATSVDTGPADIEDGTAPVSTERSAPTTQPGVVAAPRAQPAGPTPTAVSQASSNGHGPAVEGVDSASRWRSPPPGENGRRDRERRPEWEHPYPDPVDHNERGNGSRPGDGVLARWMAEGAGRRGEQRNGHQPAASDPESSLAESPANSPSPGQPQPSAEGPQPAPLGTGRLPTPRPRPGPGQLAPEHRALVDRIMAACRVAEGQNPRGGYGSSGLTPALRRIAAQLPAGGLAPDSEADTLKSADRFGAKLARLITRQPGRPAAELAACISDAIRYAFTFEAADYTESTLLVHRKLKAQGFDLEARRNCWDSPEYKGIFTRWRDPAHGLSFEVQFHSVDSWAVIKRTRDAYLRITDPVTPAAERARLRARQVTAASAVQVPHGCLDIADFRAETR